ncbi:TPA: TA system toxin CbtA family protein, partial [Escherichia coli]
YILKTGFPLADTVNFLVDKYELIRIDHRVLSRREQSHYLQTVDILRARQTTDMLRRSQS